MGGVATRYGTEDDLIRLIETAHRFGIRVYFDNVMAHNGGSTPGYDENTSIYTQPGFVPEDFHLIRTPAGFTGVLQREIILMSGRFLIGTNLD